MTRYLDENSGKQIVIETNKALDLKANQSEITSARGGEIDLATKINKIDSSLSEKATKGEITRHDLSTASDNHKMKLINLSEEVQEAMSGNAPVIASVGDGTLTREKYAKGSLTPTKMREAKRVGNLFDKAEVEKGYYIQSVDGVKVEGTSSAGGLNVISDRIDVVNITRVALSEHYSNLICYDSMNNFIEGFNSFAIVENNYVITLPENTDNIIVGIRESNLNDFVLIEGVTLPIEFIETKYSLDWLESIGSLPFPLYEVEKHKNFVSEDRGKYYFNYNVNGKILNEEDIVSVTTYTNTTVAFTDYVASDIYVMSREETEEDGLGTISIQDMEQFASHLDRDKIDNIGNYYRTHDGKVRFVMEKGTTLVEAKEQLKGVMVKYSVKNPSIIEFKPNGNTLELLFNKKPISNTETKPVVTDEIKEINQLTKAKLSSAGAFRIGTFNMKGALSQISKANEVITKSGVNVLGAQEINHGGTVDFFENYFNWNMVEGKFSANLIRAEGSSDYGNAFLSDYKILDSQEGQFNMNDTGLEQRGYLRTSVLINGKVVYIYTVHYTPFSTATHLAQRASEMQQTIDIIESDAKTYRVIIGDFNHEAMEEMAVFTSRGYKLANDGNYITSDTGYPKDDVVVSSNIDIVGTGMLPHEGASDHALFWADVVLS